MALKFKSTFSSIEEARGKIDSAIAAENLLSAIKVAWEGNDLSVRIEQPGKSEFRLAASMDGGSVQFAEASRQVAFAHRPLVKTAEDTIRKIAINAGFKEEG